LVAVVFITIIVLILMGKSTLTFLVAMSYYIYNFMNLVNSFASFSTYYQKLKVAVERIHEIIDNTLYQDMLFGEYHNLSPVGSIDFRNVTFQYHDNKKKILENFDLHIKENTKVAIIGKSGQGKSTIFNLLLRYFDVTKGKVLLDGVSIGEYDEESLRKNISIIRQDPFLFHKTILENFKMVNPKITLKEVRKYRKIYNTIEQNENIAEHVSFEKVIKEMGLSKEQADNLKLAIEYTDIEANKFTPKKEICETSPFFRIEKRVEDEVLEKQMVKETHKMLEDAPINEREKEIICLLNGVGVDRCYSSYEVADMYHLTGTRVRQIRDRAYEKLRNDKEVQKLASYIGVSENGPVKTKCL